MNDIISQDIDRILLDTSDIWTNFSNANIFITGGTGYFGIWMLITFIEANRRFNLGANAYVLTRSPERFAACFPKVAANPSLHMISGDVRFFDFPKGDFSYVIHFAADASAQFNVSAPREMLETIVIGGHHVLEFARHANVKALLFASSGAVYGSLPSSINRVSEDYKGGPDIGDFRSAYGEGKRVVELMCNIAVNEWGLKASSARCFAQIGPYMPLHSSFAAGNFIADALTEKNIVITGDGTPFRSYMYSSDLMTWLWTILVKGEHGRAYNVGSSDVRTIAELAQFIRKEFDCKSEIIIEKKPDLIAPRNQYTPDISRAQNELKLSIQISLEDAISRTVAWHREAYAATEKY